MLVEGRAMVRAAGEDEGSGVWRGGGEARGELEQSFNEAQKLRRGQRGRIKQREQQHTWRRDLGVLQAEP
ncbi:hypothetical protein B1218_32885, partial [Pseudomonas ogarae]